jgi:hypothetical protein
MRRAQRNFLIHEAKSQLTDSGGVVRGLFTGGDELLRRFGTTPVAT